MTFSLIARCTIIGAFGVAVTSSSTAVAARCAFARAKVGAVATQNITDPRLGPQGLDLMAGGLPATTALQRLIQTTPDIGYRQLALIDIEGGTASFSGKRTLGEHATAEGVNCVAASNLLAGPHVPSAMVHAYETSEHRPFGDRLIGALYAGLGAGGEAGPVKSAGLVIHSDVSWPIADLRVDYDDDPVAALAALWERWKPEMNAYVTRALDPASAPSYGVPGDP